MGASLEIDVDRSSVAMGDDVESHARRMTLTAGTALSVVLEAAAPEVGSRGWSWLAVVDELVVAVWSVDHGVQMLVDDLPVTADNVPRQIFYRYFRQIDPAWLHRRLADGAEAHFTDLEREYRPIGDRRREEEERRREREIRARCLTVVCAAALHELGAVFDLHNDRMARFDLFGSSWRVRRSDTMTVTDCGQNRFLSSIRPAAVAECWLVAAVGQRARQVRGLPPVPDDPVVPAPDLKPMGAGVFGEPRWTTSGEPVVQLTGDDAVRAYRLSAGRSMTEIVRLLTAG
ncbi:hypothetical protein QEN35_03700 [Gordonia alkanivorans]|jgi:hypothetical protein|uniref:Uncharacterized protein n=1 Tax=Gordonia alkanivorans CGMCC 6845 TaxID=1423140 RepID=W9DJG9_9ACTN|nr:hypothetical protein [Gordonia alkanivorans]AZZ82175.1 hypothetical protein C5O27_14775 [Gordonia alkanivorans]ETA06550.1 hypothetical protein V525_13285 [Gordonia alkanivorans CGMCC 6845]MDH3023489.1 hypothetical protein [Gordonia alkanivorans]